MVVASLVVFHKSMDLYLKSIPDVAGNICIVGANRTQN